MDGDNGLKPPWQPGDPVPGWASKLQEPFPVSEIGLRPQLYCRRCAKSQDKACGETHNGVKHEIVKCGECKQRISAAHLHLHYVGHADLTRRLLDTDPRWTWRPMARDVDPEVLKAAVATGDLNIVRTILDAAPPKLTEFTHVDYNGETVTEWGLWIELIVHDEYGEEVVTPGFGDAVGKQFSVTAMKEIIGDAVRNAGLRRGAALDLWRKIDLDQARKDTAAQVPPGSATALAAQWDELSTDRPAPSGQDAKQEPARPPVRVNPEAQTFADLAWSLYQGGERNPAQLKAQVHDKATAKRLLNLAIRPPWAEGADERMALSQAIFHVRALMTQPAQPAEAAQGGA